MLLKAGVDISRLERNTRRSLGVLAWLFDNEADLLVITSTYEGNHSAGSLHYANQAYDIRFPINDPDRIFRRIKKTLGSNFDVIWEKDHIHI